MVEHAPSHSKSNSKGKGKDKGKNDNMSKRKAEYLAPKDGIMKQKLQGLCYNYNQPVNLVGSSNREWWLDTWVIWNVCGDKSRRRCYHEDDIRERAQFDLCLSPFTDLCAKHEIRHEFTAPYSLHQNGIGERKNRTFKAMVNATLICSGLSQDMCEEAILMATYLLNEIHHCICIGYDKNIGAYRFIVHDSKILDIQKDTIMESRNASFFENIFSCLPKETRSLSRIDDKVVQDKRQQNDNDLQDERQD
ncbi:retrotransposon protein, putative, ty1-copia subclass [Tanacetum coccineum]